MSRKKFFYLSLFVVFFAAIVFLIGFKVHILDHPTEMLNSGRVVFVGDDYFIIQEKYEKDIVVLFGNETIFLRGKNSTDALPKVSDIVVISGPLNDRGEIESHVVRILRP